MQQKTVFGNDPIKSLTKLLDKANEEAAFSKAMSLASQTISIGSSQYIIKRLDGMSGDSLQSAAKILIEKLGLSMELSKTLI